MAGFGPAPRLLGGWAADQRGAPPLATDVRVGRIAATGNATGDGTRGITFSDLPANAPARRVQQPALFDFNPAPSSVVLRGTPP